MIDVSPTLSAIHREFQYRVYSCFGIMAELCIVLCRYVCWMKRVYQDTDSVISSVSTKVKGNILTNSSAEGAHVWDVAEYVIPPQVSNRPYYVILVFICHYTL